MYASHSTCISHSHVCTSHASHTAHRSHAHTTQHTSHASWTTNAYIAHHTHTSHTSHARITHTHLHAICPAADPRPADPPPCARTPALLSAPSGGLWLQGRRLATGASAPLHPVQPGPPQPLPFPAALRRGAAPAACCTCPCFPRTLRVGGSSPPHLLRWGRGWCAPAGSSLPCQATVLPAFLKPSH